MCMCVCVCVFMYVMRLYYIWRARARVKSRFANHPHGCVHTRTRVGEVAKMAESVH